MSASGALKSPAPIVAELKKRLSQLDDALAPVLARDVVALTDELEAGRGASQASTSAAAAVSGSDSSTTPQKTGKLQSAQLQASLAYVLLDLVWILLKVEGRDVQRHPVMAELKRVHAYLQKVQKPDQNNKSAEKAPEVDKDKARRFIQGSLGKRTIFAEDGSVQRVVDASAADKESSDSSSDEDSSDDSSTGSTTEKKGTKVKKGRKTEAAASKTSADAMAVEGAAGEGDADDGVWEKPVSKKARREAQKLKAAQRKASNAVASSSDAQRVAKSKHAASSKAHSSSKSTGKKRR